MSKQKKKFNLICAGSGIGLGCEKSTEKNMRMYFDSWCLNVLRSRIEQKSIIYIFKEAAPR